MSGTFYGRYELLRKIAAGGMAEIFLARHWGEGGFFRDVVIKRLFKNLAEHEPTLRMFHYEARLLAHLGHPNIPQAYDLGFAEGTWFIAMEYVDGLNVADVWRTGVRSRVFMPLHVTIGVALQVCEALHHAHEARDKAGRPLRIVHRDVTPQNVMLTRDGVAKLMDFGVAKTDARDDTEAGAVKGTWSYMAPEQVRGRKVDRRADVFALGVILYELTTGTRLFRGTDAQIMTQIVEEDAPAPSSRVPEYPADLEEIVLACLRRDLRGRIASAGDLALHLEHFAMRNGMSVGPRAIAAYLAAIFPSEPVVDEALALVPPPPDGALPRVEAEIAYADDAELLEDDGSEPRAVSLPPAPLAGFVDPDGSGQGPVVVLDRPRHGHEPPVEGLEDDYLSELERRLDFDRE
ncbi:MAG: serine/threonine protein kinase [Myxococcales bacterium]|nr:serine/threonine protein kinase [Myxococcales bacterium]